MKNAIAIACLLVAWILAVLRLHGEKGPIFQAAAHLVVGGFLFGASMGWYHKVGQWRLYACLAVLLSVLELAAFLAGVGK
jgi:hypothetical protein